ncbi:hypothetical protein [Marinobacter shengliensis]|uniref:hypothetical protein n=1 Tax=Marinobacter shengliensis TaxID=1389223 RepID=UPI002573C29E|nr:hypothetical protein [Marinobacter shengliensis]BEH15269.1 hypothetical protein MAALD49_26370 [Marinobacter shengliensis]
MFKTEVPSASELFSLPIDQLRERLSKLHAPVCSQDMKQFEFQFQKAYRRACYTGEYARVDFFLSGLPEHFLSISAALLIDLNALSWAVYGRQGEIVRLICSKQSDADFVGFDYDLALALLALIDENRPDALQTACLSEINADDIYSSSLSMICEAGRGQNSTELIRLLEARMGSAIDRQIAYQMLTQQ